MGGQIMDLFIAFKKNLCCSGSSISVTGQHQIALELIIH